MPQLTRRTFGLAALAAPLAAPLSFPTMALADGHAAQAGASVYGAQLGNYTITAILDGIVPLQRAMFSAPDPAMVDTVLANAGLGPDTLPAPISSYLLQSADQTILIDAGLGDFAAFGPGFGRLTPGLAALGVAPGDIDTVVLTHAHPDHLGGLLSDGAPAFPNAELVVAEAEATFWSDTAIMAQAPEGAQGLFQAAQATLGAYGDQVTLVADGTEVAPGVILTLSPGHTPGHSVLRIDGGDTQMIMLADTIHNVELHTAIPDIGFGFDTDTALAAQSRIALFDQIATDRVLVAGSHLPFPGFGRILRSGEVYRFLPATL